MQEVVLKTLNAMQSDLTPESKDELRNLISVLEEQRQRRPFSRQLYFSLSRAYRNLGDFDRAIAVLSDYIASKSDYIASKEKAGQIDRDIADAYYNRACY